jgi:hypothetical protein
MRRRPSFDGRPHSSAEQPVLLLGVMVTVRENHGWDLGESRLRLLVLERPDGLLLYINVSLVNTQCK